MSWNKAQLWDHLNVDKQGLRHHPEDTRFPGWLCNWEEVERKMVWLLGENVDIACRPDELDSFFTLDECRVSVIAHPSKENCIALSLGMVDLKGRKKNMLHAKWSYQHIKHWYFSFRDDYFTDMDRCIQTVESYLNETNMA